MSLRMLSLAQYSFSQLHALPCTEATEANGSLGGISSSEGQRMACKQTISVNVISSKEGCCVSSKEGLGCLEKASKQPSARKRRDMGHISGQSFPKFPIKVSVCDSPSYLVTPIFSEMLASKLY